MQWLFTHTLVQRGHFDSILGHSQNHLLVLRHEGKLPTLLLKHKNIFQRSSSVLRPSSSSSRSSSPERRQCKWWAPEAPAGPCSCWTATSRWLPHTWRGTRHTFQKRCCLRWGNGWGIETRGGNTRNGRAGSRDWPQLLVESVSRLATVLDLDSPPKLESTDFSRGSETQFLPAGQKVDKSVRMKCICVDVLCFWCWSHCSASCCCCGAFWPSGTSFTMTNHRLVPSPASSATWITTEHNVKHNPSQKSTEITFRVHWRSSQ